LTIGGQPGQRNQQDPISKSKPCVVRCIYDLSYSGGTGRRSWSEGRLYLKNNKKKDKKVNQVRTFLLVDDNGRGAGRRKGEYGGCILYLCMKIEA
jgi:hypothetical protein